MSSWTCIKTPKISTRPPRWPSREQAPAAWLAVMLALQDRIADAVLLVSAMATSKEPGFVAHAAGQLNALQELWDDLEAKRAEASKLS
jgi:hypothetical protein